MCDQELLNRKKYTIEKTFNQENVLPRKCVIESNVFDFVILAKDGETIEGHLLDFIHHLHNYTADQN